jgi:hypothetical protein
LGLASWAAFILIMPLPLDFTVHINSLVHMHKVVLHHDRYMCVVL